MLSISHALSSGKTQSYYREEYSSADKRYFSQDNQLQGYWHGQLAAELGLIGVVTDQAFDRLALGQDPKTAEQWIQHRNTVRTRKGKESAHRAAWDFTIHAPKTVSLAALVGGDERIVRAHEAANGVAMDAMEKYVQARMGGDKPAFTTEKWIAASFLHDTARPVDGYPAPHLHSHNVVFNLTEDITGQARSLQTKELFVAQSLGIAVYQSELAFHLKELGYELQRGTNGAPDISGFSKEYVQAESLRSAAIKERLEELGLTGRRAEEIIAHQDRDDKLKLSREELRTLHQANAEQFGNQPQRVVEEALSRGKVMEEERAIDAQAAVSFAVRRLSEREAVFDHFQVVRDALRYGQGHVRISEVESQIEQRRTIAENQQDPAKDLVAVFHHRENAPGARYTTLEMLNKERSTIEMVVLQGRKRYEPLSPDVTKEEIRAATTASGKSLNNAQRHAAWDVLHSTDQIFGLQGGAGTGKTSSLQLIREMAERNGYETKGLATISGAARALRESGVESETMQRHLIRPEAPAAEQQKTLYFVDESSLASTAQMETFLSKLRENDRVLLAGDIRQHGSIDAGRVFHELQLAGMNTFRLEKIVRQQDAPELLEAIKAFRDGQVGKGLDLLDEQGRLHEVQHRTKRFEALAEEYANSPSNTLVVSPDNRSRQEINAAIRSELREQGYIGEDKHTVKVLIGRQDVFREDMKVAGSYEIGDVLRFGRNYDALGVEKNDYGTVIDRDTRSNKIGVKQSDGRVLTYDPERFSKAQLFKAEERAFAEGDRIQLTSPWKSRGLANRDLGTIEQIDGQGNVSVRMDGTNRRVNWKLAEMTHIDYGYSMTSYSSQGQTVDRVLVQIDTADSRVSNLNDKTMLYVASSRGRQDLQIFTDHIDSLERSLNRLQLKTNALSLEQVKGYAPDREPQREAGVEIAVG